MSNKTTKELNATIRGTLTPVVVTANKKGEEITTVEPAFSFNSVEYAFDAQIVNNLLAYGLKQKLADAVVRDGNKEQGMTEVCERLARGYWNASDEKKAANTGAGTSASANMRGVTRAELEAHLNMDKEHDDEVQKLMQLDDEKFDLVVQSGAYEWITNAVNDVREAKAVEAKRKQDEAIEAAKALLG